MTVTLAQTNQGISNSGTSFTARLLTNPTPGNSVVIVIGLDSAVSCEATDIDHVVLVSESNTAFGVAGAPYVMLQAVGAKAGTKAWSFQLGAARAVTWLVAEIGGLLVGGLDVPVGDGTPHASAYAVPGMATLDTGQGGATDYTPETLFATFTGRVTTGAPPTVTGFANTTTQAGTWARLGATVATTTGGANHRLDVAWKTVGTIDTYDCTATYSAAPAGDTALLTAFRAA